MFAVPGWSVSSSNLTTQTPTPLPPAASASDANSIALPKQSKQRNRNHGKSKPSSVNSANLADLWETVIEGKPKAKKPKTTTGDAGNGEQKAPKEHKEKKKRKEAHKGEKGGQANHKDGEPQDLSQEAEAEPGSEPASKKRKTKDKKDLGKEKETSSAAPTTALPPPPKPTTQLTPLQASMRQKLVSARFRHLNQALYTTPSAHSMQLFKDNPEMFTEYHEGFRRQVEVWPENPVDGYAAQIRARGVQRPGSKPDPALPAHQVLSGTPLPRTEGTCRIADLGCGDAMLAAGLQKELKKLKLRIHSFDLQSDKPLVTRADIAALPLADDSVDIAIFCLALMGTNWVDFIEEAFRVLRWKGELWVAEIKSRFGRVGGNQKRVEHSVGKRVKKDDKKALKRQEEEVDEKDLAVEVDGHEDTKQETDVSAFVEVLRKRGFLLQGEPDLQNKMFVRMRFVKGLTPIKGEGRACAKGDGGGYGGDVAEEGQREVYR